MSQSDDRRHQARSHLEAQERRQGDRRERDSHGRESVVEFGDGHFLSPIARALYARFAARIGAARGSMEGSLGNAARRRCGNSHIGIKSLSVCLERRIFP